MRRIRSLVPVLIATLALVTTSLVVYADAGPKHKLSAGDGAIASDAKTYADENCGEWTNHGDLVSCVARNFDDFTSGDSYGAVNKGQIMRIIAQSDLGKGDGVAADAADENDAADESDNNSSSATVVSSVSITASLASPRAAGPIVTFTANPSPSGINAEYKWSILPPGGNWTPLTSSWGGNTFGWNTSGQALGEYQIGVWARAIGSSADPFQTANQIAYTLTSGIGTVTSVSITASDESPATVGTSVVFTAAPLPSGINAEYKWSILPPGGSWTPLTSSWGGNSYTWNTVGKPAGEYQIGVWARAIGSSADPFQTANQIAYTLTDAAAVTPTATTTTPIHGNRNGNGNGRSNSGR